MRLRLGGTVRFTESMPAGNQRDSFFVIHRHPSESLANQTP
jgi:hypothetical protein